MCNLHWCYTFCTGVTLFALVLHLNCTALSQSESSNFFMYIIITIIIIIIIIVVVDVIIITCQKLNYKLPCTCSHAHSSLVYNALLQNSPICEIYIISPFPGLVGLSCTLPIAYNFHLQLSLLVQPSGLSWIEPRQSATVLSARHPRN